MKIALVAPYFLPVVGGIETYVYELARRLSKDHTVYVFACGQGTNENRNGVKVFKLRAIDTQDFPFHVKVPYPIPFSLVSAIRRFDADIIHAHGHAFATSFMAALASKLDHKPFLLTVHDIGIAYQEYLLTRGIRHILDSTLAKYVFKRAETVIVPNDVTYTYALRFNPKKVLIIPQGVDLVKFKPREEGEYVTFVSRLVPYKGGEVFIRAIPKVLKEVSEARFRVIGDGFQRRFLERLVIDLGVKDSVEFAGSIPYEVVPMYLDQAKIVFSHFSGLTLLEAAAMGKPIITTRNRWAEDALGGSPLFVSMSCPEETAKAIVYLLRNPDERVKIGRSVYAKVTSERSWDIVVSRHLDLYDQVLSKNGWR